MTIRTRFAPSPTGYLHIGGVRTALYSWLHARKHGGSFILRIEDTDLERSTAESVNAILEGMTWLGLEYDEGPFYQTHRMDRYREVIEQLLEKGKAYRCYCSIARLDKLRSEQMANREKPKYDGYCLHHDIAEKEGMPYVIRFKNPGDGQVVINDLVKGRVIIENRELDDLIIARSDGSPTYNLTVVVDDYDMKIDHVIRGDDHLNNTPRQINILNAMGAKPPAYAHIPMILGGDGKRLSKRHGATSVMQYKDEGYLPEAVLNYLVRLGWSHGDQEIFSVEEMIELFDINDINNAASTFNPEKLLWLNQEYIKSSTPEHIARLLSWHLGQLDIDPVEGPDLHEAVKLYQQRSRTLVEMAEGMAFLYREIDGFNPAAAKKHLKIAALEPMKDVLSGFREIEWMPDRIQAVIDRVIEKYDLSLGKVAQPIRVAISGKAATPAIELTLSLLGQQKTLERIAVAIEFIEERARNQIIKG
ncbi:MAG TPA: glutamate--tRNA ligase [Gammaproteobacteria bacterium]|nr:glutamate--tRNA ligase [Gammaproteobacteria bacterium]